MAQSTLWSLVIYGDLVERMAHRRLLLPLDLDCWSPCLLCDYALPFFCIQSFPSGARFCYADEWLDGVAAQPMRYRLLRTYQ